MANAETILTAEAGGYLSGAYAASLAEFGEPIQLARSGGWILARSIPGTSRRDAIGCYPLFTCERWKQLEEDLGELGDELVSLCLVADPFGATPGLLQRCFGEGARPFKEGYVVDLRQPREESASRHHRYYARRALRGMEVVHFEPSLARLEEWIDLYANLVRRHAIRGIGAFSTAAFARQMEVPGLRVYRAQRGEACLGMHLWFRQGPVAYHHLAAYSPEGYRDSASYALMWSALQDLADHGVEWAYLGAGAGLESDPSSGLEAFKRGWADATRTVHLCGQIFDAEEYERLVVATDTRAATFFPKYREEEHR